MRGSFAAVQGGSVVYFTAALPPDTQAQPGNRTFGTPVPWL